jgi:hypothetical protein
MLDTLEVKPCIEMYLTLATKNATELQGIFSSFLLYESKLIEFIYFVILWITFHFHNKFYLYYDCDGSIKVHITTGYAYNF